MIQSILNLPVDTRAAAAPGDSLHLDGGAAGLGRGDDVVGGGVRDHALHGHLLNGRVAQQLVLVEVEFGYFPDRNVGGVNRVLLPVGVPAAGYGGDGHSLQELAVSGARMS